MRSRLPLILSSTALLVAVFGSTPLGHAAREAVPFAKSAGFATLAGNAQKLNGRRSTLSGAPGTIPVVAATGKLPASIGAVGPQGPKGEKGDKGDKGQKGDPGAPGLSGYQIVSASTTAAPNTTTGHSALCPAGKKVLGGMVVTQGVKDVFVSTYPAAGERALNVSAANTTAAPVKVTVYATCATVAP